MADIVKLHGQPLSDKEIAHLSLDAEPSSGSTGPTLAIDNTYHDIDNALDFFAKYPLVFEPGCCGVRLGDNKTIDTRLSKILNQLIGVKTAECGVIRNGIGNKITQTDAGFSFTGETYIVFPKKIFSFLEKKFSREYLASQLESQ